MDPADAYEVVHTVTALQGIVNRAAPQLLVNYTQSDPYWLQYTMSRGFLSGQTLVPIPDLGSLVRQFASAVTGVVLYDPAVPSTSNVASTAASARDLLPVCFRNVSATVYDVIVNGGLLPVTMSLVGQFNGSVSGSAKNDAYLWAITEFLESGELDAAYMGYYIDYFWTRPGVASSDHTINTVSNQDIVISRRGFVWDLSAWADEAPNDDPNQPLGTDQKTLMSILAAANKQLGYSRMITVSGFTPWAFKYVDSKHGGVPTEWQTAMILSQFNTVLDADACCVDGMANAAVWQHFPLQDRYVQRARPQPSDLIAQGLLFPNGTVVPGYYAAFYVGDYDSASWLYSEFYSKWNDPSRGKVPMSWALDPNLAARFPPAFDLAFSTATSSDIFISGDSGAGYLNPTGLFNRPMSGLPPGDQVWKDFCEPLYNQFDITYTGFLINGASGPITNQVLDLYRGFSRDGGTVQTGYGPCATTPCVYKDMPVFQEWDLSSNVTDAVDTVLSMASQGTHFQVFRTILETASYHEQVVAAVTAKNPAVKFVDQITMSYLARVFYGDFATANQNRVSYVADTVPRSLAKSTTLSVTFSVRNNGWNTIPTASTQPSPTGVLLYWTLGTSSGYASTGGDLQPGAVVLFSGSVLAPATPGTYTLQYQLQTGSSILGNWDGLYGVPAWEATVVVTA